eukprot:1179328-Prorocentrum_minimum.AAC.2
MYTGASCRTWISPRNQSHCTRSLLLGILVVHNAGNTAFWTFVPLMHYGSHPAAVLGSGGGGRGYLPRHLQLLHLLVAHQSLRVAPAPPVRFP